MLVILLISTSKIDLNKNFIYYISKKDVHLPWKVIIAYVFHYIYVSLPLTVSIPITCILLHIHTGKYIHI